MTLLNIFSYSRGAEDRCEIKISSLEINDIITRLYQLCVFVSSNHLLC